MMWTEDRRWWRGEREGYGDKGDVLFQDDAGGVRTRNNYDAIWRIKYKIRLNSK